MAEYDSEKDHNMDPTSHVVKDKKTGMFCVYDVNNKKVAEFKTKDEADAYAKKNHDDLMKKEAMSPREKAAHAKAIAAFKARGGKVKKLPPGKAAGYHGKDDPGSGVHGMLNKPDTGKFGTKKKVKSMNASKQEESTSVKSFFDIRKEATLEVNGITESKKPVNEATDVYDKGGILITRTALKGGTGFQINYGERGRYIQVLQKDMNTLMKAMQMASKAK